MPNWAMPYGATIMFVTNGVPTPVSVSTFPSVETTQTPRLTAEPNPAGSKVNIISPDDSDKLESIPHIRFGDKHTRSRSHVYCHNGWRGGKRD
jgi:hypothetical protein